MLNRLNLISPNKNHFILFVRANLIAMQVEDIAAFYGRKSSSVRPTTSVTTVGAVVRRQHSDASMLNLTLLL